MRVGTAIECLCPAGSAGGLGAAGQCAKKSACVSRVLACAVKKKKGEKQKWRIGASIPVPLACEASDLPIDLIPQNETDANLAVYKPMERYNHHLSQHAHPTPASALCSYRASRHRDIRANHSKSAMPKARTNSTGAPPRPRVAASQHEPPPCTSPMARAHRTDRSLMREKRRKDGGGEAGKASAFSYFDALQHCTRD